MVGCRLDNDESYLCPERVYCLTAVSLVGKACNMGKEMAAACGTSVAGMSRTCFVQLKKPCHRISFSKSGSGSGSGAFDSTWHVLPAGPSDLISW